jgi:hypothetical protein
LGSALWLCSSCCHHCAPPDAAASPFPDATTPALNSYQATAGDAFGQPRRDQLPFCRVQTRVIRPDIDAYLMLRLVNARTGTGILSTPTNYPCW